VSQPRARHWIALGALGTVAGIGPVVSSYVLALRGSLTIDLGVGRRVRPLGPIRVSIAAPRETVFDVIAAPYLDKTPRTMRDRLEVLERGSDMALAAYHTPLGYGLTVTIHETIRFERPERITFRLLRGPVPHLVETFELHATDHGTDLEYRGELGTDLWRLGAWWGDVVAVQWDHAVEESLPGICAEAERRARSRQTAA
jgi:hypothetical protein